jgi:valyl-tRNA synthetase
MSEQKEYNPKEAEERIRNFWEKEKIYKFNPNSKKQIFSIDTPPPTVSGKMHIGHAFSYSQQDFIARYRRMKQGVFYPFGTDDNGLPTERLVERLKNVKSKNMSRAEFISLCLKTIKEIKEDFISDWKKIGISCDYDISYSTIDKNSQRLSQKSFIDLFKAKQIYNQEFPTLWCVECQTAIAQAELEDKEQDSLFSTLKFSCDEKELLIATTRPELLPACVAVFYNPKDKRYNKLKGKKAKVPLFNYEVPIIEDESAEIEKGTGVMMICSYGDKYDVEAIKRHKLKPRIIFNKDGTLNELAEGYSGIRIKEARKKILNELKEKGFIKEQKQIKNSVNIHDKCGTEIEFLPTEQWFIKILDKKKELIKQGENIKWYPEFMFKRYENWVKNLEWDWNISRERHFGIPIPVWRCPKCKEFIIAEEKELPVDPLQIKKICEKCNTQAEGEEKVLDTWATSSLTPQIASSLINNKLKIPYSLRPQAHDIIRTWAFYTITKSYLHEKKLPWKEIMISGFVTLEGEKMSKSKGNVISPQEVLNNYGADALRFWGSTSSLGEDLNYQEKDLITGKKFITKLFNASKFVFMNLQGYNGEKPKKLEKIDELFLASLNNVKKKCTEAFEEYEYSKAKNEVERFFWNGFCDNYLEIVKNRVYNAKGDKKISAQYVLYNSLLDILKMIAPIMPYITEEIYQTYYRKKEKDKSIHISSWPEYKKQEKIEELELFYNILTKVRQAKSEAKKSMKAEIILTIEKKDKEEIKEMIQDLQSVTNSKEIKQGEFNVEFL